MNLIITSAFYLNRKYRQAPYTELEAEEKNRYLSLTDIRFGKYLNICEYSVERRESRFWNYQILLHMLK